MTRAFAKVIQIPPECWATVQTCPGFSGHFGPLPHNEILLSRAELIERSDSEQHSAPRTRASCTSPGTKLTTRHRTLGGRPGREKDQSAERGQDAPLPPTAAASPLCWFCFVFWGKGSLRRHRFFRNQLM